MWRTEHFPGSSLIKISAPHHHTRSFKLNVSPGAQRENIGCRIREIWLSQRGGTHVGGWEVFLAANVGFKSWQEDKRVTVWYWSCFQTPAFVQVLGELWGFWESAIKAEVCQRRGGDVNVEIIPGSSSWALHGRGLERGGEEVVFKIQVCFCQI